MALNVLTDLVGKIADAMREKKSLSVLFRVDASIQIGSGHVMRCLTLAGVLAAQGAICRFVCREHPGNLLGYIREKGFEASGLPLTTVPEPSDPTTDPYAAWLGNTWERDAEETLSMLGNISVNWVIVDHYRLDAQWERKLRAACNRLMVIDDLADRPHDCDILLDQNLGRKSSDYANLIPPDCRLAIGPNFALLRSEFAAQREKSLERRVAPRLKNILLNMGGVDQGNVTGEVLTALMQSGLPSDCRIVVVMGRHAPWLRSVQLQASGMQWETLVQVDVQDMAKLMVECDLMIGAAGGTSWERCCLGVPSLIAILADNQREVAAALERSGSAMVLEISEFMPVKLRAMLNVLSEGKKLLEMSLASRAVSDGQGAYRMARAIIWNEKHEQ